MAALAVNIELYMVSGHLFSHKAVGQAELGLTSSEYFSTCTSPPYAKSGEDLKNTRA